jgi:hypothetical protein
VLSARHSDLADPDLIVNGAGFQVSHNDGFGVPDAGVAVALARSWPNRPPLTNLLVTVNNPVAIPDDGLRLLVTGPGGALAGTLLGHLFRFLPFSDSVRGQALLLSCTLLGLGTLFFALPEARRHELLERPGHVIGLDETEFGVWAGTSIHAVPQVVAAGFAYGPDAGEVATIVKLARVLLLAPVVIGLAVWYGRKKRAQQVAHITRIGSFTTLVPPFIIGFLLLAIANTLHLLPDFTLHLRESFLWDAGDRRILLAQLVTQVSSFLLAISMAGVGLGVDLRGLARVGLGALYIGLASAIVLAGFSLALLRILL